MLERSGRTPDRDGGRPEELLGRLQPPERQILIRERGQVRYVSLSPRRQLAIAAATLFALAGVISILAALFVYDSRLAETRAALVESQASQKFLLSSIDGYKEGFAAASRSVEDDVTSLGKLIEHSRLLQDELEMVKRRVNADGPEHGRAVALQQTISKDLTEMEGALKAVEGRTGRLKSSDATLLTASAPQPPAVDPARAMARLDDIEARLAALQTKERDILQRLSDSTVVQMEAAERQIRSAGLDVDKLLAELVGDSGGKGGPYVALSPETVRAARSGAQRRTDDQIKRWENIQHAVKFVPLAAPMREYDLVSGFGPRTDPFNGRPAMHFGTDMTGPAGSPILATAAGRVVFVGWKHRYGKMVEIDHGIGIRTRYGHMKRVSVRTGQSVRLGDYLGEMGSTGRSTGTHLHYEVHVRGEPRDPMRFIKAGKNVRKS